MIRAVLFDVYGTIAGWSPSRFQLQRTACDEFGLENAVTLEGILKGYASADAFMAAENAARPLRTRDQQGRDEFFAEYERLVLQGCGIEVSLELALRIFNRLNEMPSMLAPYDDVLPTLTVLKERSLILGLISNINLGGEELMADLGLTGHVDYAITSGGIGVEKPNPLAFQIALDRAGVKPNEAVMVGDQPSSDIVGAANVGISPILIDRDGNYPEYDACPRITTLEELPALVS